LKSVSRIGRRPIPVPEGVEVVLDKNRVLVSGPKGKVQKVLPEGVNISRKDGSIVVEPGTNKKRGAALHGLARTLIANMITGVTAGYEKVLEVSGVGYRCEVKGRNLILNVGYSKPVTYALPDGIDASVEKMTVITIKGVDKELVGQVAADIRSVRPPNPYKGKGIKYRDERIVRKAGKAGK